MSQIKSMAIGTLIFFGGLFASLIAVSLTVYMVAALFVLMTLAFLYSFLSSMAASGNRIITDSGKE